MPAKKATELPERAVTFLTTSEDDAREQIASQITKGQALLARQIANQEQLAEARSARTIWCDVSGQLLKSIFSTNELAEEFRRAGQSIIGGGDTLTDNVEELQWELERKLTCLESVRERLSLFPKSRTRQNASPLPMLRQIVGRFHLVARQLRQRHSDRPTLDVSDEYDVQDLLHALLKLSFDDIRPEEWTPSYAGAASRMDFLLKRECIVVEVKKTRPGLAGKEISNQLIEDIARYRIHPDCHSLVCFVYDPEERITNPDGLERDLTGSHDSFDVEVIIVPKRQ